jgi:hypothetical protein
VYEQLAGASGAGAVDYYGGLLVAMDAIQQNVVTPTFGAPTARYAYVIATPLRIRAAGIIGTLQERATVMQLSAGGLIE